MQEAMMSLVANAPAIVRELVKPAEKISELKILQLGGQQVTNGVPGGNGGGLLGSTIGPIAKTIMETSALMPLLSSVMKVADVDQLRTAMGRLAAPAPAEPEPPAPAKAVPAPPPARPRT
jgi:hypothetical protein